MARRLRNTSEEAEDAVKAAILSTFAKAMQSSGYNSLARAEALWSGLSGHRRTVRKREQGEMQEVDRAWESRGKRQRRKLKEKSNWFQKTGEKAKEETKVGETGTWRFTGSKETKSV